MPRAVSTKAIPTFPPAGLLMVCYYSALYFSYLALYFFIFVFIFSLFVLPADRGCVEAGLLLSGGVLGVKRGGGVVEESGEAETLLGLTQGHTSKIVVGK